MPNLQDMIGLLPTTDAYVLIDPRPDKQALFNAGKMAEKLCDQQKNLQEAAWEALVSDNEALVKSVTESQNSEAAICKILGGMAVTNAVNKEDASAVFGAGYACSKSIKQIAEEVDAKSKEIDKLESVPEFIKNIIDQASKTQKTKKSAKPIRRMYFHFSSADNGCDPIRKGKIMNKPQQNLKSPNIFNISRGGSQDFNGLNISQISEELNIENERWFVRLGKFLVKNRKKISLIVICGAVLYIIFKKRTRVRKILHKIRQISKHWVFRNRISRGIIILCKYNLKYNKI